MKGGYDVIFSRSFIGGHLGLGGGRANSEHARLLSLLQYTNGANANLEFFQKEPPESILYWKEQFNFKITHSTV